MHSVIGTDVIQILQPCLLNDDFFGEGNKNFIDE